MTRDKDAAGSNELGDLLELLEDYKNSLTGGDMPDDQGMCAKVQVGISFLRKIQERGVPGLVETPAPTEGKRKIYGFSKEKEELLDSAVKRLRSTIERIDLGYDDALIALERTKRYVLDEM